MVLFREWAVGILRFKMWLKVQDVAFEMCG